MPSGIPPARGDFPVRRKAHVSAHFAAQVFSVPVDSGFKKNQFILRFTFLLLFSRIILVFFSLSVLRALRLIFRICL